MTTIEELSKRTGLPFFQHNESSASAHLDGECRVRIDAQPDRCVAALLSGPVVRHTGSGPSPLAAYRALVLALPLHWRLWLAAQRTDAKVFTCRCGSVALRADVDAERHGFRCCDCGAFEAARDFVARHLGGARLSGTGRVG